MRAAQREDPTRSAPSIPIEPWLIGFELAY
jgi:hypothetical protein